MLFPCLFLWPCSYLQDKEKESNQSALGIKLPVRNWLPGTPLLSSTHLQHLLLPEKIPHLPEKQIGQSALYSGGNKKTLQPSSRISLWKVTSSKAKLGDLGDSYYMLKIPPLEGGRVLPKKMPHLPMRQIRQVKTIPHFST
ncbi:hypothetical protein COP2_042050 [Malus domestica]